MEKTWKQTPFECDKCGDTVEVFTESKKDNYFYDEEEAKCTTCGALGYVTCDDNEFARIIWDSEYE